jgi:hypothetical protein
VQVVGVVVRQQELAEVRVEAAVEEAVAEEAVAEEAVVVVEEAGADVVEEELEVTNGGEDQFRRRMKVFDRGD